MNFEIEQTVSNRLAMLHHRVTGWRFGRVWPWWIARRLGWRIITVSVLLQALSVPVRAVGALAMLPAAVVYVAAVLVQGVVWFAALPGYAVTKLGDKLWDKSAKVALVPYSRDLAEWVESVAPATQPGRQSMLRLDHYVGPVLVAWRPFRDPQRVRVDAGGIKCTVRAFDTDRLADAVARCAEERRERDAARGLL